VQPRTRGAKDPERAPGAPEAAKHRGEARGRHDVDLDQLLEHPRPDRRAGQLGLTGLLHALLDAIAQPLERVDRDRPLGARLLDAGEQLAPVEVLAALVALHQLRQHVLDALARGEAARALETLAAPADPRVVAAEPRVDDPVRVVSAVRTAPALLRVRPARHVERQAAGH